MSYNKDFYNAWMRWALELCEQWDMNADIPEIAQQIRKLGKKSNTKEFEVLKDVFNEYFSKDGKIPTITQFEAITQCVEHMEMEDMECDLWKT